MVDEERVKLLQNFVKDNHIFKTLENLKNKVKLIKNYILLNTERVNGYIVR